MTGPLGAAGRVPRRARCRRCRTASRRGSGSPGRDRDARHLGRARARRRPHRGALRRAASRSSSSAFRSPGRELDDLGFGEDYELLAATPDPLDFPVIGRVEEGEGVELTLGGEPYSLAGWEHFR